MKVYGISGSHRSGNTELLVKKALDVCRQHGLTVGYDSLAEKNIEYCKNCGACRSQKDCVIDDVVAGILDRMKAADAIIVGTPTYFASVSGKLAALFDRTIPLRRNSFRLSGKLGGAIAVGGSRNGGQEKAVARIHDWMMLQEMIVVADKKTAHFGGIAVGSKAGDVLKDEAGLETVVNLAENIAVNLGRLNETRGVG